MRLTDSLKKYFNTTEFSYGKNSGELTLKTADDIKAILSKLKNDYGFILLLDIFGRDLKQKDVKHRFQVVYLLLNLEEHFRLSISVGVDLERNEVMPTCSDLWPGASWCERETYEMFGVSFGEKSNKRLSTPVGQDFYTLRKDFTVPSELNEVAYKPDFKTHENLPKYKQNLLHTYSIGPFHPALKGSMKIHLEVEGDNITQSELEMGFLHRGIEKSCESSYFSQINPLVEKLNFCSPTTNNIAWCKAVEELLCIEVSDRSKALRMVFCELSRIADHIQCLCSISQTVKVFEATELLYSMREIVYKLFESLTGSRVMCSPAVIGGMIHELPSGWVGQCLNVLKVLSKKVEDLSGHLTKSSMWMERLQTTSLHAYEAIGFGLTGPNLRACGVNYDIRKSIPYYFYEDVEFEIPLGINGDCYDRYLVRVEEIRQSCKIISQVLDSLPPGKSKPIDLHLNIDLSALSIRPDAGHIYSMVEAPNGELGIYLFTDGDLTPDRIKFRAPSSFSAQAFEKMVIGTKSNDILLSLCSMNIVAGEIDR